MDCLYLAVYIISMSSQSYDQCCRLKSRVESYRGYRADGQHCLHLHIHLDLDHTFTASS